MTLGINKVFVYGTLLQGEFRSSHMADCKLLDSVKFPGALYDTGRGYPAAVFDSKSNSCVRGELYLMSSPKEKLAELDKTECVETNLYRRIELNYGNITCYSYEAGTELQDCTIPQNKIRDGDWRRLSSLALDDPTLFAINFEDIQRYLYREPVTENADGLIYLKGDIPIIITAPHSSVHTRMGKLKRQEFYTGALSVILHSFTGCHVLYTNRLMDSDPNYYDDSPFKIRLREILEKEELKFLLDIHGTGPERESQIYPGIGNKKEFLHGNENYLDEFCRIAEELNISVGGLDVFPAAKQMTVTKYAATKFSIPSMQIEINRKLREPEKDPEQFMKLTKFLKEYIDSLLNLVS